MERKELIDYISKLNERNLKRQSASGFTLWAIVGVIIIAVIFLVANYIANSKISLPSDYEYIKLIFKTSIEIFLFFVLIVLLAFQIKAITKHSWLEQLERDIYLNELSTDEIMDRLETEYIGSSVTKWIQKQREKCNDSFSKLINELNDFNARIESLRTQKPATFQQESFI